MIPTGDEILARFASRLSCTYEVGQATPSAPSASTLPYFLSSAADGRCSFPRLSLKSPRRRRVPPRSPPTEWAALDAEAKNLGRIVRMGRHNVAVAPVMLLRNLLCSFGHMIGLRVERTLINIMERSAELEDDDSWKEAKLSKKQARLSALFKEISLSDVPLITPVAAAINFLNFLIVQVPNDAADAVPVEESGGATRAVVPLEFEAAVDVLILGKETVTVLFRAPGSISGLFTDHKNRPDTVDVRVDPEALMDSMKKQCREVVRRAVMASSSELQQEILNLEHPPKVEKLLKPISRDDHSRTSSPTAESQQTRSRSPGGSPKPKKQRGRSSKRPPSTPVEI